MRVLVLLTLVGILCGCRTTYEAQDMHPDDLPTLTLEDLDDDPRGLTSRGRERPPIYAKQINDTLIYPVQTGRAEDYAETLRPILENRYGGDVIIIAHEATNQLIIKIPPYDPEDVRSGRGRSSVGRTPRSSAGSRSNPPTR